MHITKDTLIGELLEQHPAAEEIIIQYIGDVGCLNCPGKYFDTLEASAALHGIPMEKINALVKELNKKFSGEEDRAAGE